MNKESRFFELFKQIKSVIDGIYTDSQKIIGEFSFSWRFPAEYQEDIIKNLINIYSNSHIKASYLVEDSSYILHFSWENLTPEEYLKKEAEEYLRYLHTSISCAECNGQHNWEVSLRLFNDEKYDYILKEIVHYCQEQKYNIKIKPCEELFPYHSSLIITNKTID